MPSETVDKIITDNYRTMAYADIALLAGKSRDYVKIRVQRLGLKLDPSEISNRKSEAMRKVRFSLGYKPQLKTPYFKRHPERKRAETMVRYKLKSGRLTRLPCAVCKDPKSEAHHPDYNEPLNVVWLCRKHHFAEHKRLRQKESIT